MPVKKKFQIGYHPYTVEPLRITVEAESLGAAVAQVDESEMFTADIPLKYRLDAGYNPDQEQLRCRVVYGHEISETEPVEQTPKKAYCVYFRGEHGGKPYYRHVCVLANSMEGVPDHPYFKNCCDDSGQLVEVEIVDIREIADPKAAGWMAQQEVGEEDQ
jgi:hypothetical protein